LYADKPQIHPLLGDIDDKQIGGDGPDDISLKLSTAADTSALDAPDPELAPMLEQLRRSLENMQGNHVQVAGIETAVTHARAALDHVLFQNAGAQQYAAL